jgi:hypothetical protein
MKKWMKICLIVVCALLVFELFAWIFGYRISPFFVEKAKLYSYDDETLTYHSAELTAEEAWKIVLLYNFCTTHLGVEMVDGPTEPNIVELQVKNGGEITMLQVRGKRLIVKPGYLWADNRLLWNYIQDLLEKYDLPAW